MHLDDLQTFAHVVQTGSFTRAAELLGVPKSTVSRRVARLEDGLGVELLARKPRSFTVTADGQRLHARVAPALQEIRDVERELAGKHESIQGPLRITAPHDFGTSDAFAEMLAAFTSRWPDVVPDVELTMRAVDLLEEGFDVAFRARTSRQLPDLDGIMVRRLRRLHGQLFASPHSIAQHGRIQHPRELADVRYIGFSARPDRLALSHRETGEERELRVDPLVICNDFSLLARLVQRGVGVGFVPDFLATPLVERGELEPVLPTWFTRGGELVLLWPASRHLAPRVRSFIDFAIEHLAPSGPLP